NWIGWDLRSNGFDSRMDWVRETRCNDERERERERERWQFGDLRVAVRDSVVCSVCASEPFCGLLRKLCVFVVWN
ncbi:MAG: hypothetical protein N7Q72_05955, partial [Spiroplasma sp. Tabriz.8]|nr:hypothetical protein [Spiroplasma sp. Tabriz.8]